MGSRASTCALSVLQPHGRRNTSLPNAGRACDDEPRFALHQAWLLRRLQHLNRAGKHPIYATVALLVEGRKNMKRWLLMILAALALTGCGYNDFQRLDEQTKSAWSEVLNQYQRRADLVPNLVSTVKGEANFEQETLTRWSAGQGHLVQVTPKLNPRSVR
jgi:hypothetical protein